MKLKNTLGLHISYMIGTVAPFPVIELRTEINTFPWMMMLKVVVGGWDVHRVILNHNHGINSGMLAMKHAYGGGMLPELADGGWYSGHQSLTADCLSVGVSPIAIKMLNNGRSGAHRPWTVALGNLPSGNWKGKDLNLSFQLEPRDYQLPFIANVGTIGHRTGIVCAETPLSRSVFSPGRLKQLLELGARHSFRPVEIDDGTKYYIAGDEYGQK